MSDKEIVINLKEQQRRLFYFEKNFKIILNEIKSFDSENMNIFDNSFTQSVYNWVYDIKNNPICLCKKNLKFNSFKEGYGKYCSRKCVMSDKELIESRNLKSELTSIKKWGVSNPMKVEEVKNKVKKTNIKKYGVESYTKTNEFKQKIKDINNEKYGTDWFMSSLEFKNKSRETNLKNCGYDHHSKSNIFKSKMKELNVEKWGVDNYTKTKDFKNRMIDYYQSPEFSKNIQIQKELIKNKIFEYYKNYNINYNLIDIECSELLLFCNNCKSEFKIQKQLYYLRSKNNIEVCTHCNNTYAKNISEDESNILNFIKLHYRNEIITNGRSIISPLELDIYLPDLKLGFEFNGLYWHSELHKDKKYHLEKTNRCNELGIQLFHIWEDDWLYKQDIVKSMILNKLNLSNKIYARKCSIKEVENKEVRWFLIENHIQGYIGAKVKLGLYYNDELVSLMTFGNLRKSMNSKSKEGSYELIRFCNKLNYTVVGGANKLFKYFLNNYNPKEIISYSDYSRSNGNLYKILGFGFIHLSEPGYYWCKDKLKYNRFNFRKDILVKHGGDISKSEVEIMQDMDYLRVYDSGMQKWGYKT